MIWSGVWIVENAPHHDHSVGINIINCIINQLVELVLLSIFIFLTEFSVNEIFREKQLLFHKCYD